MEKKKTISLILLTLAVTLICYQAFVFGSAYSNEITNDLDLKTQFSTDTILQDRLTTNQFNESAQPKVWLYANIVVLLAPPIVMIVQMILDSGNKKDEENPSEEDSEVDEIKQESRIESAVPATDKLLNVIRFGFLAFFIQNIAILLLVIVELVTIPIANPDLSRTIMQVYTILFHLDYIGGILIAVGLAILAMRLERKWQGFAAAFCWIAWIAIGITPRIKTTENLGIFGTLTLIDLEEFGTKFYNVDIFLITFGTVALTLALFYTANVLTKDDYLKGKGMLNAFGITNYVIGAGFSVILLVLLSYGGTMTPEAILSMIILWGIFFFAKFIVSPVIGLIAGIIGFRRIKLGANTT
ncbi:MAG: hypothetical protein FK732_04640 [Asgard group archaeon]|nr:hypothetical protein [Asgard group archaeon]